MRVKKDSLLTSWLLLVAVQVVVTTAQVVAQVVSVNLALKHLQPTRNIQSPWVAVPLGPLMLAVMSGQTQCLDHLLLPEVAVVDRVVPVHYPIMAALVEVVQTAHLECRVVQVTLLAYRHRKVVTVVTALLGELQLPLVVGVHPQLVLTLDQMVVTVGLVHRQLSTAIIILAVVVDRHLVPPLEAEESVAVAVLVLHQGLLAQVTQVATRETMAETEQSMVAPILVEPVVQTLVVVAEPLTAQVVLLVQVAQVLLLSKSLIQSPLHSLVV